MKIYLETMEPTLYDVNLLIQQPANSRLCGQACIAMAACMTLQESIDIAFKGHKKGTTVRHLVAAARRAGLKCKDGLTLVTEDVALPPLYIAQVKYPDTKRNWHWVLVADRIVYDPAPKFKAGGTFNKYLELSRK